MTAPITFLLQEYDHWPLHVFRNGGGYPNYEAALHAAAGLEGPAILGEIPVLRKLRLARSEDRSMPATAVVPVQLTTTSWAYGLPSWTRS